jgi:hypothetical protein
MTWPILVSMLELGLQIGGLAFFNLQHHIFSSYPSAKT